MTAIIVPASAGTDRRFLKSITIVLTEPYGAYYQWGATCTNLDMYGSDPNYHGAAILWSGYWGGLPDGATLPVGTKMVITFDPIKVMVDGVDQTDNAWIDYTGGGAS